ncbi:hypothetical protein DFH09DRAFT_1095951 [Mycena vulgaris]|nr:hypothetical protein DFH09DRAFT_1095951 [Mycena vulgaris]
MVGGTDAADLRFDRPLCGRLPTPTVLFDLHQVHRSKSLRPSAIVDLVVAAKNVVQILSGGANQRKNKSRRQEAPAPSVRPEGLRTGSPDLEGLQKVKAFNLRPAEGLQ